MKQLLALIALCVVACSGSSQPLSFVHDPSPSTPVLDASSVGEGTELDASLPSDAAVSTSPDAGAPHGDAGDAGRVAVACGVGQKSCSGACVAVSDPAYGCGVEGCAACPSAKDGISRCSSGGKCDVACADGFNLCGGACVPESASSCGASCKKCGAPNTNASCKSGSCEYTCEPGFVDCDGDPSNGCEVNIATDSRNCGACGDPCLFGSCVQGRCTV